VIGFVIAGHSPSKTGVNALLTRQSINQKGMDARVKPGHDKEHPTRPKQKAATVSRGGFRHLRRAAPQMKPDPLPNPEL
jgi:hypothetical protein